MKLSILSTASGLALCAFLMSSSAFAQSANVDANGMPNDHSTPAEQAQTANLNNQVSTSNAQADATYQAQQQQYQAEQQKYQDRSARYDALRERYASERAAYHRGIWPDSYNGWMIDPQSHLIGDRVELISGSRVGTVIDTAHNGSNHVEALEVKLDSGKVVWIDSADIRYNRADGIVMTNLNSSDLRLMADERL